MKDEYPHFTLSHICRLLGITRQSYYQHFWRLEDNTIEDDLVVQEVLKVKKNHRHMGGRKIYQ